MKAKRKKDKKLKKEEKRLGLFDKDSKEKKIKRINSKKSSEKKKSPFRIIVRNWGYESDQHEEIELNSDSKIEVHIDKSIYRISVNKKNRCLEFDTLEQHLFLQPISIKCFLVKANTNLKANENGTKVKQ